MRGYQYCLDLTRSQPARDTCPHPPGFRRLAPLTRYISTHAVLAVTASVGALVILGLTAASAAVYDAVAKKDGISGLDRP